MRGYLKADAPGVLQAPDEGWYDTGDIVSIDADGYVTIEGRQKRFAKIAGEMISLSVVESAVAALWPNAAHAVVAIPDPKKGEQIALLTTQTPLDRDALRGAFQQSGISALAVPRRVLSVASIPILGTGKVDYQRARQIAVDEADSKESTDICRSF